MFEPVDVLGVPMLVIACVGLAVNVVTLLILRHGGGANLNVRAALLHVTSDLLGSVAAIGAALIILATGWTPIDPILSMVITLLILRSAWLITKDAGHILLEGAPERPRRPRGAEGSRDNDSRSAVDPPRPRLVAERESPRHDAARAASAIPCRRSKLLPPSRRVSSRPSASCMRPSRSSTAIAPTPLRTRRAERCSASASHCAFPPPPLD